MEFQESGTLSQRPRVQNTLTLIKGNQVLLKHEKQKKKLMFRSKPRDKYGQVIELPSPPPIKKALSPTDAMSGGTQELTYPEGAKL
jgi:hypothetical protein